MSSGSQHDDGEGTSVLELFEDWYHVIALVSIVAIMYAIRVQAYENFIVGGEVFFSGNDAWYHFRETMYIVKHWPFSMPFDPWTGFPYGNSSGGHFGSLYDQIIATVALIVGLGNPSDQLVAKVVLLAPAAFGSLTAIPTYLLGKRFGGSRFAGVFSAVILMLLPGTFLRRTLVGFADHNGVEPVFQAFAVWGLAMAFVVAQREMPVWEVVREEFVENREVDTLETPLKWSLIGGVLLGLYLWVWPPGIVLVGIMGLFLVVKQTSDYLRGNPPEPPAFAAVVMSAVALLMTLVKFKEPGFATTQFSFTHVLALIAVPSGSVFLAWLARYWDREGFDESLYPVAVAGAGVFSVGALAVVAPDALSLIRGNLLRTVGFSAGAQARTVGEAQPYISQGTLDRLRMTAVGRILSDYGFAFFSGLVAAVWLLAKPLLTSTDSRKIGYAAGSLAVVIVIFLAPFIHGAIAGAIGIDEQVFALLVVSALIVGAILQTEYRTDHLLFVVWGVFITSMAFTQVRFNYYLAVVVAVFNAYLIGELLRFLDLDRAASDVLRNVEGYQVLAVIAAVMLILTPALLVPISVRGTGTPSADKNTPAWKQATQTGPGAVTVWDDSLEWMRDNTPKEGTLGGADNEMEYYGTYHARDGDFEYPDGAYGVQSWWDYGHWITVEGHRIPNANPFQQGATQAANYLLAPNASQAREVLASQSTEGERTRFVMVDWQMATVTSKFSAPVVFYSASDVSQSDFYTPIYRQTQQGGIRFGMYLHKQRYYESMMIRLYQYHGSARSPAPVVFDWEERRVQTRDGDTITIKTTPTGNESVIKQFRNMSAARSFVREDGSAQVGGFGDFPAERVEALEHYRLVKVSNTSAYASGSYVRSVLRQQQVTGIPRQFLEATGPAWIKTFERVPGATVEGSGAPPNATVTATVELYIPTSNTTFSYTQRARANSEGEFTMTLPYSTTGYANYGPENGYTNVSVRATGPYRVFTGPRLNQSGAIVQYRSTLNVSEGDVNGDADGQVQLELERRVRQPQVTQNNSSSSVGKPPLDAGSDTPADTDASSGPSALDGHLGLSGVDGSAGLSESPLAGTPRSRPLARPGSA